MHCLRPMLLTPAKNSQRDDHFCGRLSVYSYCYESGAVSLDSSGFILGGESIRKFDFWIGVFLSGTSGSIQKSTSGSIRIYPQKTGLPDCSTTLLQSQIRQSAIRRVGYYVCRAGVGREVYLRTLLSGLKVTHYTLNV